MNSLINDIDKLKKEPRVFDDVISKTDVAMLYRTLLTFSYKQGHKSSVKQEFYETAFVHYYDNEKIKEMSFYKKVKQKIEEELNFNLILEKAYVHSYGLDQKTLIHADNSTPTVMLYCNPNWQFFWGGETILYDDDMEIKKVIVPRAGRVAIFDGNTLHCGRSTTLQAPDRRYAIAFKFLFADSEGNPEKQNKELIL